MIWLLSGTAVVSILISALCSASETATFAIGEAGATNAALFAVAMLAADDPELSAALAAYRATRRDQAAASVLPPG